MIPWLHLGIHHQQKPAAGHSEITGKRRARSTHAGHEQGNLGVHPGSIGPGRGRDEELAHRIRENLARSPPGLPGINRHKG